jgi:hypothetical protein
LEELRNRVRRTFPFLSQTRILLDLQRIAAQAASHSRIEGAAAVGAVAVSGGPESQALASEGPAAEIAEAVPAELPDEKMPLLADDEFRATAEDLQSEAKDYPSPDAVFAQDGALKIPMEQPAETTAGEGDPDQSKEDDLSAARLRI